MKKPEAWLRMEKTGVNPKVLAVVIAAMVVTAGALIYLFTPSGEGKLKIAVVSVEGGIENFSTSHAIAGIMNDNSIKAVVIKMNSPGGYVSTSFQLESTISELSNRKNTFGVVEELGASGAYLAISAVDNLYVHRESIVGGLGVIAVWVSLENKFEEEGIEHHVFKTGPHKDMFAPWRSPTENEKKMIEDEIYRIEDRMLEAIIGNRPSLENNPPKSLLEGEVFYGFEAVQMGLADKVVMSNQEVIEEAASSIGLEEGEYEVVRIK